MSSHIMLMAVALMTSVSAVLRNPPSGGKGAGKA